MVTYNNLKHNKQNNISCCQMSTTRIREGLSQTSKPASGSVSEQEDDVEEDDEHNDDDNPGGLGFPLTPGLLGMSWRKRLRCRVS